MSPGSHHPGEMPGSGASLNPGLAAQDNDPSGHRPARRHRYIAVHNHNPIRHSAGHQGVAAGHQQPAHFLAGHNVSVPMGKDIRNFRFFIAQGADGGARQQHGSQEHCHGFRDKACLLTHPCLPGCCRQLVIRSSNILTHSIAAERIRLQAAPRQSRQIYSDFASYIVKARKTAAA